MHPRHLFALCLLAACHAQSPVAPVVTAPAPAAPVAPVTPITPVVTAPAFTRVLTVSQPTALAVVGDALVTTDMRLHGFVLLAPDGSTREVPGAGHYPPRIVPDGAHAWIYPGTGDDGAYHLTDAGMHTPLTSGVAAYAMARDARWLYVLTGNAPNLRRVPRTTADGRPLAPDDARTQAEELAHVADAVDLAADDAGLVVATRTALVRLDGRTARRLTPLPARPTRLALDGDMVFIGSDDGTVLRVDRRNGETIVLGRVGGAVTALLVHGCFVYVGFAEGLVALERDRGVRVPLHAQSAVLGLAVWNDRLYLADYTGGMVMARALPACPSPSQPAEAHPLAPAAAPTITSTTAPADDDPLALRHDGPEHTAVVRFGTSHDEVAHTRAASLVTRVLADVPSELWVRARDAQLDALREQGFDVAVRDGTDRLRCVDVRRATRRVPRVPPPPWHAPTNTGRAWLVQLAASTQALPDLMEQFATAGITLLDTVEPATVLVEAAPAAANALRGRVPVVTFVTPWGPWERLVAWPPDLDATGPCAPPPDDRLRALARWIATAPEDALSLSLTLFRPSRAVEALVRAQGGTVIDGAGTPELRVRVPRRALGPLGDAADVRGIEGTGEASPAAR